MLNFEINELSNDPDEPERWWAQVSFNASEVQKLGRVAHKVSIDVAVTADTDSPLGVIRELAFLKAIELLGKVHHFTQSQTAQILLEKTASEALC